MQREDRDLWKFFNAFAMSDNENSDEGNNLVIRTDGVLGTKGNMR